MTNDRKLAVGDLIWIYEDPVTMKKPEGIAKVIRIIKQDSDSYRASVKFEGGQEEFTVERFIRFPLHFAY